MRKKLIKKGQEELNLLNPNGPTTITIPSTFTGNIDNISSPSSTFSNISLYNSTLSNSDKLKGITGLF